MLHAGMGATHVNALLSSLNIPRVHGDTLKAREREIGPAIEDIANTSCERMLEEEKKQWGSTERVNEQCLLEHPLIWGGRKEGRVITV